jgi:hypothetical protein
VPLSGRFRFIYSYDVERAADPEGEVTLEPWDFISLPAGLWREFRNVSDEMGWVLGIIETHNVFSGVDPYWSETTKREAREHGLESDERGRMIKPANYEELVAELSDRLPFTPRPY